MVNGLKMQEELADPESYSLAALSSMVDPSAATSSELYDGEELDD